MKTESESTQAELAAEAEDFDPGWDAIELQRVACCTYAEAVIMLRVGEARRRREANKI